MEELYLKFKMISEEDYQIRVELYDKIGNLTKQKEGIIVPFDLSNQKDSSLRRTCRAMVLSFVDEMDQVIVRNKRLEGVKGNKAVRLVLPDKMVKIDFLYKALTAKEAAIAPVTKRLGRRISFGQYRDKKYCKQVCYPNGELVKMDNSFENSLVHSVFIPEIYGMLRTDDNMQREIENTRLIEREGKMFYQLESVFGDFLEMEVKSNYFEINGIVFIEKLIYEDGYDQKKVSEMTEKINENGLRILKCKVVKESA